MKSLLFLIFTLLTLVLVSPVSAQTATPSARPLPKREAVRTMIAEKKTERIEKLSVIKKERIFNFSNKMILRLEATVERLQKLITRIDERIKKIDEESDVDTLAAKASLGVAQKLLTETVTKITALKAELETISTSEDPKTSFETAKESLSSIKEDLKIVHRTLVETIGMIKGLRVGNTK